MATFRFRSSRWQARVRRQGHPDQTRSFLTHTMRSYVDKLVSDGVTPLLMGCLVGGAGSPFWTGYNAYMESKFPMLEPVLTLGVLGRS